MQTRILYIFTRTPLHVGAGSSVGAIDQPVIRERHTRYPIIPGSALKGVISDLWPREQATEKDGTPRTDKDGKPVKERTPEAAALFGAEDAAEAKAGAVSFGEARLLAFPLRSAKGSFALATCPLALARYARDASVAFAIPQPKDGECFPADGVKLANGKVALEEFIFAANGAFPADWAGHLSKLLDDAVLREAATHFVLLSDGDFAHFAANACQVQHHNKIDDTTGTVADGALFNTETVPSEALFYSPIAILRPNTGADENLSKKLGAETLLQFGGDATTGLGFCTVKLA